MSITGSTAEAAYLAWSEGLAHRRPWPELGQIEHAFWERVARPVIDAYQLGEQTPEQTSWEDELDRRAGRLDEREKALDEKDREIAESQDEVVALMKSAVGASLKAHDLVQQLSIGHVVRVGLAYVAFAAAGVLLGGLATHIIFGS